VCAALHGDAIADALACLVGDHRDGLRAAQENRVLERLPLAREPADLRPRECAADAAKRAVAAERPEPTAAPASRHDRPPVRARASDSVIAVTA